MAEQEFVTPRNRNFSERVGLNAYEGGRGALGGAARGLLLGLVAVPLLVGGGLALAGASTALITVGAIASFVFGGVTAGVLGAAIGGVTGASSGLHSASERLGKEQMAAQGLSFHVAQQQAAAQAINLQAQREAMAYDAQLREKEAARLNPQVNQADFKISASEAKNEGRVIAPAKGMEAALA